MLRLFRSSFIFGEATSAHFFRVNTQQLLFRRSFFLRLGAFFWGAPSTEQSLLHSSYFSRIATFSEWNFYQAATSSESDGYLGQLLVGTATFSAEELLSIKRPTKDLRYFQKTFLSIAVSFSQQNFSEEILFYSYASFPHLLFLFFSL